MDVPDTERNRALLDAVAETFADAICEFCQDSTLEYDWLKYLPTKPIADEFWKTLTPKTISILSRREILRSRSEKKLYKPSDLRFIPRDFTDEDGEPLFDFLTIFEVYGFLSSKYNMEDKDVLCSLGVTNMDWKQLLDMIEADLYGIHSRIRGNSMSEDWHTRVATLLSKAFANPHMLLHRVRLESLPLIPLQSGEWVSFAAKNAPIYFPPTGTSDIPEDSGFALVSPSATKNPARVQLFRDLGVSDYPVVESEPMQSNLKSRTQLMSKFVAKLLNDLRDVEASEVKISLVADLLNEFSTLLSNRATPSVQYRTTRLVRIRSHEIAEMLAMRLPSTRKLKGMPSEEDKVTSWQTALHITEQTATIHSKDIDLSVPDETDDKADIAEFELAFPIRRDLRALVSWTSYPTKVVFDLGLQSCVHPGVHG